MVFYWKENKIKSYSRNCKGTKNIANEEQILRKNSEKI